jgi:glucose/arabinose dehydrogenase
MRRLGLLSLLIAGLFHSTFAAPKLIPHRISLANGKSFDLNLPEGYAISVAAQGLKRVRFMAMSPDNRIFVTDMYNLTDNTRGVVYILDQFDTATHRFKKVTKYLSGLRNPNSVAFYKDRNGTDWFYLALTDRLLRYRYEAEKDAPSGTPEVLATFPDYGLGYKYGGWHLTRTVVVGGNGKIYVAVGSSCNACGRRKKFEPLFWRWTRTERTSVISLEGCAMLSGCVGPKGSCTRQTWARITSATIVPLTPFMRSKPKSTMAGLTVFKWVQGSTPIRNSTPVESSIVAKCLLL